MMKRWLTILLWLFPLFAFADASSLSFAPPSTDLSVIFLSNLFGVVDGVLHGTGSQILGTMFGVFNSAVIALGGIIIMYTLIVSTMNTAHEGQFLGQKWSSIWVPVRSVVGIALLMPKASGYCMIQIFVMWVCVQGVGAADKIWNAALDYLNRGGVIIKPQMAVKAPSSSSTGSGAVYKGAAVILEGQVCMLAIQNLLSEFRKSQLDQKKEKQGVCYETAPNTAMDIFCNKDVPDFLASVNTSEPNDAWNKKYQDARDAYDQAASLREACAKPNRPKPATDDPCDNLPKEPSTQELILAPMPNFKEDEVPYNQLNGLCGTIKWNSFLITQNLGDIGLTSDDKKTLNNTRAIAVQQLYNSVSLIAQAMVNNIKIDKRPGEIPTFTFADQYGIPLTTTGSPCTKDTLSSCVSWGPDGNNKKPVLFRGTEMVGAVLDYMAIMEPSLRVQSQASSGTKTKSNAVAARKFIENAKQEGWLMAGSYFFKLALLNQLAMDTNSTVEGDDSGLDKSDDLSGDYAAKIKALKEELNKVKICEGDSDDKCSPVLELKTIFSNNQDAPLSSKIFSVIENPEPQTGALANTIWGFVQNSLILKQPGQPGMGKNKFTMNFNFGIKPELPGFGNISVPCGDSSFWVGCIVQAFLTIFLNIMLSVILPNLMAILMVIINQIIVTVLQIPLTLVGNIFISAVSAIQDPLTNPIVALANMGILYLNAAVEIWITVMSIATAAAANPLFAAPLAFLMLMITPLLGTWLGLMAMIGFLTAYYVPFIPFMVFTFGVIGWLIAVIESMVAAPIVALGISSPEGDQALGKAEHAIMLLMNVFLRPGMMVIGYIAAIALSYVGVWVVNAGFVNAVQFIQGSHVALYDISAQTKSADLGLETHGSNTTSLDNGSLSDQDRQDSIAASASRTAPVSFAAMMSGYIPTSPSLQEHLKYGHVGWAGVFGLFFSILIYTSIYWTVVQESFNLIAILPDKILRWIGGQQETLGQETLKWGEQTKGQVEKSGEGTLTAAAKGAGQAKEALDKKALEGGSGTSVEAKGGGKGGDKGSGGGSDTASGAGGNATPPSATPGTGGTGGTPGGAGGLSP